jgi:hypothetical protein
MWTQYRKQPHADKTSVSVCRAARIFYPCSRIQNNKRKKGKINKNQTQQPPKFAIRSKQTELSKRKFQKIKNHQLDNKEGKKQKKKPSQKGERKRGHNTNHKSDDLGYMTPKNARFFSSLSRIMRKKMQQSGTNLQ